MKVLRRLGGVYTGKAEQLAEEIHRFEESSVPGPEEPAEPIEPTAFRDCLLNGRESPEMVWLPSGTFTMSDDKGAKTDEKPAHQVNLGHLGIGKYPVTIEEYDAFCEATGKEKLNDRGWGRGHRPVIYVSWDDVQDYCQWLSKQTGQEYALLTEAQWEYACRAGSTGAYCFGDDEKQLGDYAWYASNTRTGTEPVGEKKLTPGICTICMETCGSGCRTGM